MAYRTAARSSPSDTAVVCKACGGRTPIALEDKRHETFRCRTCELEQPVLRDADDLEVSTIELVEVRPGSYEELSPLLAELGSPGKTIAVDLRCDGILCDLGLSINSGTVMGLDMIARYSGLPPMRLVREGQEHADKKERGIIREVQTGDPAFDDHVYIESAVSDGDVRTFFASHAVRAAAVQLLRHASEIKIDESGVSIYVPKDRSAFDTVAIRQRLALLRVLAGAPRPLVTEQIPVPVLASLTKTLTYLLGPVAILVVFIGLARYMTIGPRPLLVGIVLGVVLAALLAPVFTLLLRGRSTSHSDIFVCRVIAFLFLPVFSFGALLIWNGAMDQSPESEVEMPVVSTSVDSEDDALLHVDTVDEHNESHSYSFRNTNLRVGTSKVRVRWRSGALGWRWQSGDAIAFE